MSDVQGHIWRDPRRSQWWERHRAVSGYLVLIFFMFLVVGAYQRHVDSRLHERDRRSCAQRNDLSRNQVVVLKTLVGFFDYALNQDDLPTKTVIQLHKQEADLMARFKTAAPRRC